MPYELFHNKATRFGSPQLTIRGGRIAFNADAGDILAEVGMRFAHLLFDVGESKVAIRPVKKEDEHSFAISIPKGKRGGTISAESFLNYIRWHAPKPIVVAHAGLENETQIFKPGKQRGSWPQSASISTGLHLFGHSDNLYIVIVHQSLSIWG